MRSLISFLLIATFAILSISCSNARVTEPNPMDNQSIDSDNHGERAFLGYYTIDLDPETSTGTIEVNREAAFHMNAKQYLKGWPCGNCLKLKNIQFLPGNQVSVDIEVTHPVPYSIYTVFDLRVIAIFPANQYFSGVGVSYALLNRDGLTALWDNPTIPGYISGFKAYNKGEARRPFGPGDIFTENFLVQLPSPPFKFDIAVDASWKPNDGVNFPITMNSFEVIDLYGDIGPGLLDNGGSADLRVSMYDYQGTSTISNVKAFSDDLFTGPVSLSYISGDGNNATYGGAIANSKHAAPGIYNVLVRVVDTESVNYSYDFSAYMILSATVVPSNVEITLAEDDNYKTPGNYYLFNAYGGPMDHTVINYFDTDGPWDFRNFEWGGDSTKTILATNDPEVSGWAGNFPTAQHFVKNDGNFGLSSALYYMAERHDYAKNTLVPLGIYETEYLGGAVVFSGTINGFPYPFNKSTSFSRTFKSGFLITVTYNTTAIGVGACAIPLNGGTIKSALLVRNVINLTYIIQVGKILTYEWYDDDGNMLAIIAAANMAGETPIWDEATYEITGNGGLAALYEIHRQ